MRHQPENPGYDGRSGKATPGLWLALALCVAGVFSLRYALFHNMEPHSDATYYATCLRDVVSADHPLPKRTVNQSFLRDLETDDKSLLYAIGRPLYAGPFQAFGEIPFLIEATLMAVIGYSYRHFVAVSILGSVLGLIPLTFLFVRCTRAAGMAGITGALLYASAAYVMLFSPWGMHNWGVLALITATTLATPLLADRSGWQENSRRRIFILGGLTLLAAYSNHTNVILFPSAMVLALAGLSGVSMRKKLSWIALYGLFVCAGLAPVGFLALAVGKLWSNFGTFAHTGSSAGPYFAGLPHRTEQWIAAGVDLFSALGLVLGLVGITWMALVTPFRLPFWLVVAHLTSYCLIPGFIWAGSDTYLRTYNYVIPFLALGMGWLLLHAMRPALGGRAGLALRFVVGAGVAWHLAVQFPVHGYTEWAKRHSPDFVADYLEGQGHLRPIVADLERRTKGQPVVFWTNDQEWVYLPLAAETTNVSWSSITAVLDKKRRGIDIGVEVPENGYVIAGDPARDEFSPENLADALFKIHGRRPNIEFIAPYPSPVPFFGSFLLYRIGPSSD